MSSSLNFCRICKKEFISERAYKLHLKFRHQNESTESIPKKQTMAKAKSHKCNQCNQSFQDYAKYQCHIKSKHKNVRFQCPRCDKTFIWLHHLDEHSEIHEKDRKDTTNQNPSIQNDDEEQATKPKSNKCSFCDKSFTRFDHKKKHEVIHGNEKPFKCRFCGNEFFNLQSQTRHEKRIHS